MIGSFCFRIRTATVVHMRSAMDGTLEICYLFLFFLPHWTSRVTATGHNVTCVCVLGGSSEAFFVAPSITLSRTARRDVKATGHLLLRRYVLQFFSCGLSSGRRTPADIGSYTYGLGHPMKPHRMRVTHDLVSAYGMLDKMQVLVRPRCRPPSLCFPRFAFPFTHARMRARGPNAQPPNR